MATEKLPFDEGREAYMARKVPDTNPYSEDDWKHEEWWLGWSHKEECDSLGKMRLSPRCEIIAV